MPREAPPRSTLRPLLPVAPGTEWVGGRATSPFFVTEGGPYRPAIVLWLELPDDLVVGSRIFGRDESHPSFAQTLLDAMRRPAVGAPRRPERIRVADLALVAELRSALGGDLPVVLGATPEFDRVLAHLSNALSVGEARASYLEDGRISPELVATLFRAAAILWTAAPWRVATDDQVIRVDVEEFDVTGACLSIIGNLGESLGFLLFPSIDGYEAFLRAAEARKSPEAQVDLGTNFWALNFERGADLPATMRREIDHHRWPIAAPRAYPVVEHRESDGLARPLVDRDVRLIAACAMALGAFFARHREIFARGASEAVSESFSGDDGLSVRLTVPSQAFDLFDADENAAVEPPRAATPGLARVGRNDPCPCGSGRKYKKCHLRADRAGVAEEHAPVHAGDERLVFQMREWAERRFGIEWRAASAHFADPAGSLQLVLPWSVYHYPVRGRPIVAWFLEDRGERLSPRERAWLGAQQDAWLSIWEVTSVEPAVSIRLRDLLSGAERTVHETTASRMVGKRDALLGRIVTHEGMSVLCGAHPRLLPPVEAAAVVRQLRARLRRRRDVPLDRLRDQAVGRFLIEKWEKAVAAFDRRRAMPPALHNTDGDPVALTVDHFDLEPGTEREVEARLAAVERAQPPEPGDTERCFHFTKAGNRMHRDWESTTIGTAFIGPGSLRLETNSTSRAAALRRQIEAACGDLLRYREREETDPYALRDASPASAPISMPPEAQALVLEMKQRHYTAWLDEPLPALSGKTPREATRTAAGRERVDVLLKDLEHHEDRLPEAERFDVAMLRVALGLTD